MSARVRTTFAWIAMFAMVATLPAPALAWGARGHRIATRIAQARLTPAAAAAVRELLNKGDTLVDIANWADHEGHDVVPGSASWHYVNVPIREHRFSSRFCARGGCVVSKIHQYRKTLADHRAPRRDRQLALLFLVHLIEDVHQPLHVGDNDDRGGNLTQLQYLQQGTNLHRLWDSGMIDHASVSDRVWVERISPELTDKNIEAWSKGTVEDWATESLVAAQQAYRYPKGSPEPMPSGTTIGKDYEELAIPVIRERLAQAGVRLANELNAIFR